MRIEAYTQVQQLYNNKNTAKTKQTTKASFADQLQISSLGKDIQTAKQAVANAPDIRGEVVAPIKTAIQNGTYQVSGGSIAEKLLKNYDEMR